jgi:hypothetical protein
LSHAGRTSSGEGVVLFDRGVVARLRFAVASVVGPDDDPPLGWSECARRSGLSRRVILGR